MKIITKILHVLGWILCVFCLIMALGCFGAGSTIGGIILIIAALVISPLFEKIPILREKIGKRLLLQIVSSFVLFIAGMATVPTSNNAEIPERNIEPAFLEINETIQTETTVQAETVQTIGVTETETTSTTSTITSTTMATTTETMSTTTVTIATTLPEETETETETKNENGLQELFLLLTPETSMEDILLRVDEFSLEGTAGKDEYGINIKVSYNKSTAKHASAKAGEHLTIYFDKETKVFMHAAYFKEKNEEAVLYSYGVYGNFNEENPNNLYSGYYYFNALKNSGGITIKHKTENSITTVETGYYPCESAEDALSGTISDNLMQTISEAVEQTMAESPTEALTEAPQPEPARNQLMFVLNTDSNCIHIDQNCSAAEKILPENYQVIYLWEDELPNYTNVYWACGKCSKRYTAVLPKPD